MTKKLLYIFFLFTATISAQTKIESAIETSYNGSTWTNDSGYNYEYDSNNNLISTTIFFWNSGSWEQAYKSINTYNADNKITESLQQQWDGSQYTDNYRNIYSYNSNGDPVLFLSQAWDGGQWIDEERTTVSYANSKISEILIEEWNGSQWVNIEKEILTYSGNNISQALAEEWKESAWSISSREVFSYNSNNQLTLNVFETWNGTSWIEGDRTNYEFDSNGNLIRETSSYGSQQEKTEYTYDLSAQLSNFAHPFKDKTGRDYTYENMPHVNKVLNQTYFSYNASTESFSPSYKTTYNYNAPLTLTTKDFKLTEKINIYPNPAANFIKLNGEVHNQNISVYSAFGKKIFEQNIELNNKINIENLSKGVYFLKLENGNTLKFLKK